MHVLWGLPTCIMDCSQATEGVWGLVVGSDSVGFDRHAGLKVTLYVVHATWKLLHTWKVARYRTGVQPVGRVVKSDLREEVEMIWSEWRWWISE